jgi:inositol-phosphate transport system substrate-binding protein
MRKIAFCSLAALALVLSACPPRVVEVTRIVEVTPAPKEITISVWAYAGNELELWRGKAIAEAAKRLNKDLEITGSPVRVKVDVVCEPVSWADFKKKFTMAMEAEKGPDIFCTGHEDIAAYYEAGWIIPLDDYIAKYPEIYDDVFPALWESCTYKGMRLAVPQDTEARPFYWSKKLLRDLGWSEEEIEALPDKILKGEFTLDDVLRIAKEAVEKGVVEEGYGFWHRPSKGPDFYEFYYAFGGRAQDPATGKLVLTKDAMLKHLKFHGTLTAEKLMRPDVLGMEWKEFKAHCATAEEILFIPDGTWRWADWAVNYVADRGGDAYLKENMGFGLIPAAEKGGRPNTLSHPLVYVVTTQSKHPEIAFRLITIATYPDLNTIHAVESNHLGITRSQISHHDYAEAWFLRDTAYMLDYTTFLPNHPDFGVYDEIVFRALSAVEAGEVTPEEALDIIVEEMKAELGDKVIIE